MTVKNLLPRYYSIMIRVIGLPEDAAEKLNIKKIILLK